jgi:hypothetical protein
MSVVIDEFDVVADEGQSQPPGAPSMPANTSASAPAVHDIERAIERQCERDARVWAH